MSEFIDYGNYDFQSVRDSDFVDKSGLIEFTNERIGKERKFICISRPRRFGKSVAAKMLYAYYDRSSDSRELFRGLEAEKAKDYETHLNKYPTIYIDWNRFANIKSKVALKEAQKWIVSDLKKSYPMLEEKASLTRALSEINDKTGDRFIMIIDEWDRLVREVDIKVQTEYVDFLRSMFKSNAANKIFLLVYMTGILPIIKTETQSALNNFEEFSVVDPGVTAKYYGFTRGEVEELCKEHNMDIELMRHAYDGYIIGNERSMFNPNSVMMSISKRNYNSFWTRTASFTTIEQYIKIDADRVREKIISMLNGESVLVKVSSFRNDMKNVENSDDVLTLLVHLGYLSYDPETQNVRIPDSEVAEEFENAIGSAGWGEVSQAIKDSRDLLDKTIKRDVRYVSKAFDTYRFQASSILEYNDENSMACAIRLAYYAAISFYKIIREMPAGKGFADMVFVPLRNSTRPAIVVELKYDKTAKAAIDQIKEKNYPECLKGVSNKILLVGINYDKAKGEHQVVIEEA
ncbi:MAG: AAA family ATPase [Bacteroidales bacterium]|nr:AAA family ATPase [Bacteroidales bacterium]